MRTVIMAGNANQLVMWQWNCASFKRRRAPLQQSVASQAVKPYVIVLQETLCDALTFPGYRVVTVREEGSMVWQPWSQENAPFRNTYYNWAKPERR